MNTLIYNTLQFDQYGQLDTSLFFWKKFGFQSKILKTNSKFKKSFSSVCRAHWDKTIDIQCITIWSIFGPLYSFEYISVSDQNFLFLGQNFLFLGQNFLFLGQNFLFLGQNFLFMGQNFWFLAQKFWKLILNSFLFVCRAHWDESIDM